ncbi:hypothetical protein J2P86_09530 [Staphylococcus sp. 30400_3112M30941]|nr:hypothetical protein [Staphylococcus sp. 30403_3112M30944]MBO0945297.1 hypothetical protein [Staphylococcus sp. 30402_3112M30943]MBO0964825.1 hypothetical protein [Staphylococcus sp. 30400_3112M30941]MBO0965571.1 hypothetical protein [Staphylococcus sp. 30401_3112M30942]
MIDALCRNKKSVVIFIIVIILLFGINCFTQLLETLVSKDNREELFSFLETIVSFSSITTAFLFFGVSFIPMISEDNKIMKVFKNNEKNYEEFIVCAIQFLLVSTVAIVFYFWHILHFFCEQFLLFLMLSLLFSAIINMIILFFALLNDISKKIRS